jgi:hypothetical protein
MMGSFLRSNWLPEAVVTIEVPMARAPDCAYEVIITDRATEDRIARVVRDGIEIMAVHPDGRVEVHPNILVLADEIGEG